MLAFAFAFTLMLPPKITNSDFSDASAVQNLADAWFATSACQTLTRRLESACLAPVEPRPKMAWSSNLRQVRVLISRMVLNGVRDPAAYGLRWACVDEAIVIICFRVDGRSYCECCPHLVRLFHVFTLVSEQTSHWGSCGYS